MYKAIDISNCNGNVDMNKVASDGYSLVLIRATEGTSGHGSRDEYYHQNIANAKAAGLLTGAYHFARFYDMNKCKTEIDNFRSFIADTNPDVVVLDYELETDSNMTEEALHFMDSISDLAPVLFYTASSFLQRSFDSRITKYPLWIACYGVQTPDIKFYNDYAIWQYSDKGSVRGVSNGVDVNYVSESFLEAIKSGSGINYTPVEQGNTESNSGVNAVASVQSFLNEKYGFGLSVDGKYGPATKKAIVKAIQTELNNQFGCGLSVDGEFGPLTKAALGNLALKNGSTGIFVKLVQALLICRGWNLAPYYADGSYGDLTASKVNAFQSEKGLTPDSIAGMNTISYLIELPL